MATLGSDLHAFPFSSALMEKILGILGAFRWGISAQHIRPGMFKEFLFTYTHTNYFPTQFQPLVCCLLSNVPQEKACGIVIPSEGEAESRVRLVLCAGSHYFFEFRQSYGWVLCAGHSEGLV